MSDYIYENRQLSLWDEYKDLKGTLSMDAFMERHYKVNAYIINLIVTIRNSNFSLNLIPIKNILGWGFPSQFYKLFLSLRY